jgi:DNA-directed RNA polymerase II subunit RPB2
MNNMNLKTLLDENMRSSVMKDYFKTYGLLKHQLDSFNWFVNKGLKNAINNEPLIKYCSTEKSTGSGSLNPLRGFESKGSVGSEDGFVPALWPAPDCERNPVLDQSEYCLRFQNICLEPPTVVDNDRSIRPLFPQEARNKDLSYTGNVCVDVIETISGDGKPPLINEYYRVPIAKIPVMVMSDSCTLHFNGCRTLRTSEGTFGEGEGAPPSSDRKGDWDRGGYFIINGKERLLISQIRKVYNKPLCYTKSISQKENVLICEMRSMCDETFHSTSVQVKMVKQRLVVSLKLKGKPVDVPVGVVFKSLGYDLHNQGFLELFNLPTKYNKYLDNIKFNCFNEFEAEASEDSDLKSDEDEEAEALEQSLVKVFRNVSLNPDNDALTIDDVQKSLDMDFFPHLGLTSTQQQRGELLALMVKKYLLTFEGDLEMDNRDDYNHKRVETAGELLYYLFRLLYKKFQKTCISQIKTRRPDISNFLRTSGITSGIMYSFSSGYWGVQRNTYIRTGVSQVVNPKVSTLANISCLRRVVIPESKDGKDAKISEICQIHPSSAFLICPVETPEGKGVGTVLNLALFADVTCSIATSEIMQLIDQLNQQGEQNTMCHCNPRDPHNCLLLLINGAPYGFAHANNVDKLNFLFDKNISIAVNHKMSIIELFSDSGRLIRPVYNLQKIKSFKGKIKPSFDFFLKNRLIRYIDVNEVYANSVAIEPLDLEQNPVTAYNMMELHPCGILGIVAAVIPFSDRTQSVRNCFYASMVKQAIGFIPDHHLKTETVSHTLTYPQKPLVTTKVAEFNGFNEYPNGINAIVAIACYTGYNQEDSVILNKSSVDRGLFHTTTYNTFSVEEKKRNSVVEERVEIPPDHIKMRDCNYGLLRSNGVVQKRQLVKKGDVLIGKVTIKNKNDEEKMADSSIIVQSGEEGYIDRVVDTMVNGCRVVKVVVAQTRVPEIGDKFCSGMAQKGTCGMVYAQEDMPFTSDGMVPDIIINPNCIPSRMTVNQIIATVMGKLYTLKPEPRLRCGDPFARLAYGESNLLDSLCSELTKHGFDNTGGETMYCGFTGRKIKSKIFIGPTYYHRLKHMVADKMHARSHGQVTTLHRQPNCGRAHGGGLRFGEMEKDCIIVHGATQFLNERMFLNSDPFQIDVCCDCGMMASTAEKCHVCNSFKVKKCNIPYSFKNLLQELNAIGIKTKLEVE